MKLDELKSQITEIVTICRDVPDEFRARCFEMLLGALLESPKARAPDPPPNRSDKDEREEQSSRRNEDQTPTWLPIPGVVKAFFRKYDLPESLLTEVVMVDGEELHFLKEPGHTNTRKGQNEWALLLALKNALLGKTFTADPEAVRSTAQDKGFYDKANFATNFKKDPYQSWYKGSMVPQGAAQTLSKDGEAALAELLKALTT
jgi:hypothetical protein